MTQRIDDFVENLQKEVIEQAEEQFSKTVVEHWLHPRNPGPMENPDGHASLVGDCGDTMEIYLRMKDGKVKEARFMTDGCITSIVSGSMAVELATGKSVTEVLSSVTQSEILDALGGLPEESEHCALLAADAVKAALVDYERTRNEPWKRLYGRH